MKKTALIILGLVQFSLTSLSQEKIQLYFNSNWEVTSKEKAVYSREAEYDLQNFTLNGKVTDRDLKGNLVMEGNYLYGRRNGDFNFYYGTGNIESKGAYLNNKRDGKWVYYYPNGRLKQSVIYFKDKKKGDFGIGEYFDQNGKQLIKNGKGKWMNGPILISEGGKSIFLIVTGKFKDSLKTGTWRTNQISKHKVLLAEQFREGRKYEIHNSSSYRSPGTFEQRRQDEMRTGIAYKNIMGVGTERVEPGDVTWRTFQQQGSISPGRVGVTTIPEIASASKSGQSIIKSPEGYSLVDNIIESIKKGTTTIDKMPDTQIKKLNKTEMLIIDKDVYPQSLFNADLETLFKTISPTEIRINNRKAMYPKGDEILMAFISSNIQYPITAFQNKVGGTVFVNIAIDSSGNTKEVKVFKEIDNDLDKEAARVIAMVNKWLPAIKEGKAVESTITIPVKFDLTNYKGSISSR
jgi:periplasmic protein TonB